MVHYDMIIINSYLTCFLFFSTNFKPVDGCRQVVGTKSVSAVSTEIRSHEAGNQSHTSCSSLIKFFLVFSCILLVHFWSRYAPFHFMNPFKFLLSKWVDDMIRKREVGKKKMGKLC